MLAYLTQISVDESMRELLKGLGGDEFRAIAIDGLRRWVQADPARLTDGYWSMNGHVGLALVPVLAERVGRPADEGIVNALKEWFWGCQGDRDMQPWIEFISWFIRAGFAFPVYHPEQRTNGYPAALRLTSAGRRFLDAKGEDPFLPRFVERVVARCPDLPDEVGVHLADARTCLDHGLGRPAVVLAGLAYEVARAAAVDTSKFKLKKGLNSAQQIAEVKKIIPTLFTDRDESGRAWSAWDFADHLRDRRNDASHPTSGPDFSDVAEVEELLLSAARHLPALWSVR